MQSEGEIEKGNRDKGRDWGMEMKNWCGYGTVREECGLVNITLLRD